MLFNQSPSLLHYLSRFSYIAFQIFILLFGLDEPKWDTMNKEQVWSKGNNKEFSWVVLGTIWNSKKAWNELKSLGRFSNTTSEFGSRNRFDEMRVFQLPKSGPIIFLYLCAIFHLRHFSAPLRNLRFVQKNFGQIFTDPDRRQRISIFLLLIAKTNIGKLENMERAGASKQTEGPANNMKHRSDKNKEKSHPSFRDFSPTSKKND